MSIAKAPQSSVRTAIAAHRGGAAQWPENSREAFRNSANMGVDYIEFDVHRTADGHLVVHHDSTLGRTSVGEGSIAAMRWSELKQVPLRGTAGECVPDLDEVLGILGQGSADLRLEIKQPRPGGLYNGIEQEIVERLRAFGLLQRTTFTAFDSRILATLKRDYGWDRLIFLVRTETYETGGRDIAEACRTAQAAGVTELAIRVGQIRPDDRARCQERGLRLGAFRVNEAEEIEFALAAGMVAFTTDRPNLALAMRAAREAAET